MLTVTAGAPFDVELSANPTTGYVWELVSPPAQLHLLGSDFKLPPVAAVGGGGTQVFHLQVDRAGRFGLQFQLKRHWETAAIETRVIEVEAR